MQVKRWHLGSSPQNSTMLDESKSSLLLFRYCVDKFYPLKDTVGKKVPKLRSIAELREFYSSSG